MKMLKKANHNIHRQCYLLVLWSGMFLIRPALAIESINATPPLVGHKPELRQLHLPEGSLAPLAKYPVSDHAKVNTPLTLADMGIDISALVIDEDGDVEGGSTYEWLIDGALVGTSATFTPAFEHGGQLLSVRVTPKTKTGTPDVGNAITSNQIVVRSAYIDNFSAPYAGTYTFANAEAYCSTLGDGYHLPTVNELQQLYQEMTRKLPGHTDKDVISDVCERYGWPLYNQCGGRSVIYWANDKSTVNMQRGDRVPNATSASVTCIR